MIFVILLIFQFLGINGKKINYNEKKKYFVQKKLSFGLLPKYIARLGSWALGAQGAGRRASGRWAQAGAGALGWACAERAGGRAWARGRGRRWALGRAGGRGAQAAGARRRWGAGRRADTGARGRRAGAGRRADTGGRAGGRGARGARGRARRQARARAGQAWLGVGRAAWARGLALGCALGALGLFLARFDSAFS